MGQLEYDAAVRQQKVVEEGEAFAKTFGEFVNRMAGEGQRKAAIAAMLRDHRTLQQNSMRFCMEFIGEMAGQESDLRNEASVVLAGKIMEIPSNERILPSV